MTPRLLLRSIYVVLLVGALGSASLQAQVTDLGPAGSSGSGGSSSPSGGLYSITDDPDPFGVRYGSSPRRQVFVVWDSESASATGDATISRLRPLPLVLVVDPASGAILGFEILTAAGRSAVPGPYIVGEDGFVRIALPARVLRRR